MSHTVRSGTVTPLYKAAPPPPPPPSLPFETGFKDGALFGGLLTAVGRYDGGWWVTDGDWDVTDGSWRVTDVDWNVTDGGWRVIVAILLRQCDGGSFCFPAYRLPPTSTPPHLPLITASRSHPGIAAPLNPRPRAPSPWFRPLLHTNRSTPTACRAGSPR